MHSKRLLCKVLCVVFLISTCLAGGIAPLEVNATSEVFASVNFDQDTTDGSLIGPVVYDNTVYHNSGRSLKYQRTSATSYDLVEKTFTASVGQKFSASCWVKTQNISAGGSALICIQAYDANGEWLDGAYLDPGVQGTSGWTLLSVPTYQMPANTAKASVAIYISRGATGTAWYDDLTIYQEVESEIFASVNFDQDTTDGSLTGPVVYDSTVYHNSGRSLKYQRTSSTSYDLVEKTFTASVGQKFSASCWVKTQNISSGGSALICIQAYDANGGWLDGAYLDPGVQGTSGWTLLSVPTYQMPANTAKASVVMYISRGATGTAWFDDLTIYKQKATLLETCLVSPPYRGITADNKTGDIKINVNLLNSPEYDLTKMKLVFEMINSSGTTIASSETSNLGSSVTGVFNSSSLTAGKYTLRVTVKDKATLSVIDKDEWPITKVASQSALPSSYVDNYGRFIKDGKPFFPLGFFFSSLTTADVDEFANSDFNTVLPYSEDSLTPSLMNYINSKGLKVVYSVKDYFYGSQYCKSTIKSVGDEVPEIIKTVNAYKNYPALLGWYINDEVSAVSDGQRLSAHYNAVTGADYNHPAFEVDYRISDIPLHDKYTDIYGTDIYPISGSADDNIAQIGTTTKSARKDFQNRPLWMCLQVFNKDNYDGYQGHRAPNLSEVRNMAWQHICEGATGLMFYSWFDIKNDVSGTSFATLWGYSKQVATQVKTYVPMIMSVDQVPAVTVTGGGDWLNWTVRNYNNKTYIFSVNNTKTANVKASYTITGAKQCKDLTTGESLTVTNGKFTTRNYGALGVGLYEITY